MNVTRRTMVFALGLILVTSGFVFGQFAPEQPGMAPEPAPVEVSLEEGELERFTRALIEVQLIQQEAQLEIQQVLDASDLDMMRFQELHQAMMTQQALPQDVSESEEQQYEQAIADIQDVEMSAASHMEGVVVDQELAVERFNEIAEAIPHDPELAEELNELAAVLIEQEYSDRF